MKKLMLKMDNYVITSLVIGFVYFIATLILLENLSCGRITDKEALIFFMGENTIALGILISLIIKTFLHKWSILSEIETLKVENEKLKNHISNIKHKDNN